MCHGIPSGIQTPGDRGYHALAEKFQQEGFAALIFNFRGAGNSEGNFDILGWTRDMEAAIDYLWKLSIIDKSCISLLGFSAGAAVSIYAAAKDNRISSITACASPAEFSFITEADDPNPTINHFRNTGIIKDNDFPHSIESWINGFREAAPIKYIASIAPKPLLLLHSRNDEIVPVSHAQRLYDSAGEPKTLVILEGAEHRLRIHDEAMNRAIEWFKSKNNKKY